MHWQHFTTICVNFNKAQFYTNVYRFLSFALSSDLLFQQANSLSLLTSAVFILTSVLSGRSLMNALRTSTSNALLSPLLIISTICSLVLKNKKGKEKKQSQCIEIQIVISPVHHHLMYF